MSDNYDHKFDQRFSDELSGFEAPYDPADWADLKSKLDAPARRRRRALWLAVPLAVGLSAGAFWWFSQPNGATSDASLAVSESPLLPSSGSAEQSPGILENGVEHEASASADAVLESATLQNATKNSLKARGSEDIGSQAIGSQTRRSEAEDSNLRGSEAGNLEVADLTTGVLKNRPLASEKANKSGATAFQASNPANLESPPQSIAHRTSETTSDRPGLSGQTNLDAASLKNAETEQSSQLLVPGTDLPNARDAALNASSADNAGNGVKTSEPPTELALTSLANLHTPELVLPLEAQSHWSEPFARDEKDPTLQRNRRLVDWAVTSEMGMNAEYTAVGDGFRPGWDVGLGTEIWFKSGVFLSADLRYGEYHFHMSEVACGNPIAYGIKEPVHCPDAMLGNQVRWEIPIQVGYGWDLEGIRWRLRVSAGINSQRVRVEDYWVQFNNPEPGVLLFYEPVSIAVTDPNASTVSFDANDLLESTSQYTVQTVGPEERLISSKVQFAGEFGFGYEQFLAPSFSLGIEPRLGVPFNRLSLGDKRAYYGGVSARLRWYPGIRH